MQQFNSDIFSKRLKQTYTTGDKITKLIFLYVILFLISFFFSKGALIGNLFITAVENTLTQPWKLLTYSFFFSGIFDLIFKCYLLRVSASMFNRFFDTALFLRIYFTGIFLSGCFFLILTYLPLYSGNFYLILSGNIPGILAVLSALTYHIPEHQIRVFGEFSIKMLYLMIGITLLFLFGNSLAYVFTYLFSVLVGRIYMMLYYKGVDLAMPIDKFLTTIIHRFKRG